MTTQPEPSPTSGWATSLALFAGVIMIMVGIFQTFAGLAALINDKFYVITRNYAYELDVTGWGWIHLILGVVVALAGVYVLLGRLWARIIGITMAVLSAIANFFFIPYYPVWAVLIIALDVFIILALATYRGDRTAE